MIVKKHKIMGIDVKKNYAMRNHKIIINDEIMRQPRFSDELLGDYEHYYY